MFSQGVLASRNKVTCISGRAFSPGFCVYFSPNIPFKWLLLNVLISLRVLSLLLLGTLDALLYSFAHKLLPTGICRSPCRFHSFHLISSLCCHSSLSFESKNTEISPSVSPQKGQKVVNKFQILPSIPRQESCSQGALSSSPLAMSCHSREGKG